MLLDWEGRMRPFDATLEATGALADLRVLHALAAELGVDLGTPDARAARPRSRRLGSLAGRAPAAPPDVAAPPRRVPAAGEALLATWHHLLDDGRLQDDVPHLAGTRRAPVARL